MTSNKIDEQILNIKRNSSKRLKEDSSNKIVIKSNKSITSPKQENSKVKGRIKDTQTQTLVEEIEYYEESVQTKINKEKETQTDFREILEKEDKNYDEKRLQIFLQKSLILVEDVLNAREDEEFECILKFFNLLLKIMKICNFYD